MSERIAPAQLAELPFGTAEELKRFLDALPRMIWFADAAGRPTWANQRWRDFAGEDAGDLSTGQWRSFVHPDDVAESERAWDRAVAAGEPFTTEIRVRSALAEYRWVEVRATPMRDGSGTVTGWSGTTTDRHRAKAAEIRLRLTDELFEAAMQTVSGLVYDCDVRDGGVYRSSGLRDIVGIEPEDSFRSVQWWYDRIHPEDFATCEAQFREAVRSGALVCELEYRVRHADGRWIEVWDRTRIVRDEAGEAVRIIGYALDVSGRLMAERALRESEAKLRRLVESNVIGIIVSKASGEIVEANDAVLRTLGYSRDDFAAGRLDWRQLTPPEWIEADERGIAEALQRSECMPYEKEYVRKDGSRVPILLGYAALPGDEEIFICFVIDMTPQKEVERQLRQSEEQYRAMGETIPFGVWLTDPAGKCIYLSQSFLDLVGMTLQQAQEFGWADRLVPEDVAPTMEKWLETTRSGCDWEHEHRFIGVDGAVHTILSRGKPVRDVHGTVVSWAGINLDITARKAAEVEREELLAREQTVRLEAERANRAKDDFLATLSHELRTPMTSIMGWVSMMRMGLVDPATHELAVASLNESVKQQARLIDDLLDVSRAVAGKLKLDLQKVDVADVVASLVQSVRPTAEHRSIAVTLAEGAGPMPVLADEGRIRQVVSNLLANSIKFTPKGGAIEVRVSRVARCVEISVKDSGIGIDPEFLPAVFDRFTQSTAAARHEGLGLGLAIVRQFVELHGGSVDAASEGPGKGAEFRVRLPLISVSMADSKLKDAIPRLDGTAILVVDADSQTRRSIQALLASCGARVSAAESISAAMRLVEDAAPDLVVADVDLPFEDGFALIMRVRLRDAPGRRLPVIALSPHGMDGNRETLRAAGFDGCVAKPVEPAVLFRAVADLMRG